jgi:hypothetical protein
MLTTYYSTIIVYINPLLVFQQDYTGVFIICKGTKMLSTEMKQILFLLSIISIEIGIIIYLVTEIFNELKEVL